MPKVSASGAATAYGQEGIVRNAEGGLSELDPSRNLDGTPVDGFTSDERDLSNAEERPEPTTTTDFRPNAEEQERMDEQREKIEQAPVGTGAREGLGQEEHLEEGEQPSRGSSSATSTGKAGKSATKK
jgi:hypothetical protein